MALFLGNNAIGDKGAEALADGLRHARGLQELHLNDNEASYGDEGGSVRMVHTSAYVTSITKACRCDIAMENNTFFSPDILYTLQRDSGFGF